MKAADIESLLNRGKKLADAVVRKGHDVAVRTVRRTSAELLNAEFYAQLARKLEGKPDTKKTVHDFLVEVVEATLAGDNEALKMYQSNPGNKGYSILCRESLALYIAEKKK